MIEDNPDRLRVYRAEQRSYRARLFAGKDMKEARAKILIYAARFRSKEAGADFTVTLRDLMTPPEFTALPDDCANCGGALNYGRKARAGATRESASLDRLVPSLGYVSGNVWILCHACNSFKKAGTPEDHERIAASTRRAIAERMPQPIGIVYIAA